MAWAAIGGKITLNIVLNPYFVIQIKSGWRCPFIWVNPPERFCRLFWGFFCHVFNTRTAVEGKWRKQSFNKTSTKELAHSTGSFKCIYIYIYFGPPKYFHKSQFCHVLLNVFIHWTMIPITDFRNTISWCFTRNNNIETQFIVWQGDSHHQNRFSLWPGNWKAPTFYIKRYTQTTVVWPPIPTPIVVALRGACF